MRTVVIASNNKNKLRELRELFETLCPGKYKLLSLGECSFFDEVEEDADTFEGNALKKAETVCHATGFPAISDDSGLEVDALNGAPGVFSARYAGEGASSRQLIDKLLTELRDVPENERTAHFTCVMCAAFPNGKTTFARGECDGSILFAPTEGRDFGYDPVFFYSAVGKSFSQMDDDTKNTISHRAIAMRNIIPLLEELPDEYFDVNNLDK